MEREIQAESEQKNSEDGEAADKQRQAETRNILRWERSSSHNNWRRGR